jgi:hypothetical protein
MQRNSRSHRSWREPSNPFRSIGEIYLGSEMFSEDDEAAKTIGEAAVGPDFMKIIENRRKVKGRLSDLGAQELHKVVDKVMAIFPDSEIKVSWDRFCGCSMCPCSPGYRIKMKMKNDFTSNDRNRFNLHVNIENGKPKYAFQKPKDSWQMGYDNVEKLEKEFSDGQ